MDGLGENPDQLEPSKGSTTTTREEALQKTQNGTNTTPTESEETSSSTLLVPPGVDVKKEEKEATCAVPTINFNDFVSLLAPSNVDKCLCCSTTLLYSAPPSSLPEKKADILKSFCDILNLPFGLAATKEEETCPPCEEDNVENEIDDEDKKEEEKEEVDFPFCFHCTNKKVLLLTMVHQKLQILQAQFDKLKDDVIKDILRVFVTNMIVERKLPVEVIRETKICERMYHLFKRHSERRTKNSVDSETQTDISSVSTPLLNPSAVASLIENAASGGSNRRKKLPPPPRKSESPFFNSKSVDSKSWNNRRGSSHIIHDHNRKFSPVKSSNHGSFNNNNNAQSVIEESIVPFDEQMNGGMFVDHGIINLGESENMFSGDYTYFKENIQNPVMNGLPTIDSQYPNAIGAYEPMVEVSLERKSSPLTYTDLDSVETNSNPPLQVETTITRSKSKFAECEVCGKSMLRSTIKMHMEQIHGDVKPYHCRGCDRRFARKDHFLSHEERHVVNSKRVYFCHRCVDQQELIVGKTSYVSHCETKHGIEDDVVEYFHFCDAQDCNESYKVKEDFRNHVKSHWQLGESFICGDCEKTFAEKKRFIAHRHQAHRDGVLYYDCQFCYMGFEDEGDFSRHLIFHKVKMPEHLAHTCEQCKKSFETLNRLRRHIYCVHVRQRNRKSKHIPSSSNSVSIADEESNDLYNDDDDDSQESTVIEKPDFQCEGCGKSYTAEFSLKRHQKKTPNCTREVDGDPCEGSSGDDIPDAGAVDLEEDEDYLSPSKRKRRKKSSGKASRPRRERATHTCPYCSGTWKANIELRRHIINNHKAKHLKRGQVSCVVCFHVFDTQELLDDHCDERHSKYKCHVCNKQLQSSVCLKQHMERHKVQPFMCKLCEEGFPTEATLKMHNAKVHSKNRKRKNGEDYDAMSNSPTSNDLLNEDPDSIELDMMDLFQM